MFPWKRKLVLEILKLSDGHSLDISCDDSAAKSDILTNIRDMDVGNIPYLRLNNCQLVETFAEIVERVNGDPLAVRSLTMTFTKYENQTLRGPHFHGLINLVNLTLDHNEINVVGEDFFIHLPRLEVLNLNNNPGLELHRRTLQHCPILKVLQLANCEIKNLSTDIFKNLVNLRKLNLHNNKLENDIDGVVEAGDVQVTMDT